MRTVHSVAQHHGELLARLGALFLPLGPPDAPCDVVGTARFGSLAGGGLVSSESVEASSAVIWNEDSLDTQVYDASSSLRQRSRIPVVVEGNRYRQFPKKPGPDLRLAPKVLESKKKAYMKDQVNQLLQCH